MKPLFSIFIPAFNAEAWIGDTVRSALAQTWQRKEIITVDDRWSDQAFAVALEAFRFLSRRFCSLLSCFFFLICAVGQFG